MFNQHYPMNRNQYRRSNNNNNNYALSEPTKTVIKKPEKQINCDKGFNLEEPAPEFTLTGIVNGVPRDVSLSDYRGKWVVVFFYGSDFTFV